ncbi:MAG: hypothetical protein A4E34_01005 [Methanoregula sp. PtaU1.Bin006]|nr:MAG: hypothetical protein A4E33_01519 [Methanoregula sp. PtaB.Bin085]OPY35104.1 MAG: hypothetical protein A4E34_01005 [Methanoregula sp. PtaU1.Bin006]
MLAEHLVYTAAFAILAGMLSYRSWGRDSSWIVILVSYAPDLDKVMDTILKRIGLVVTYDGYLIHHGTFHTIAAMIVFSLVLAFLLHPLGIRFIDTVVFTIVGFGAHLFEDALVYPAYYMYLWPLSHAKYGLAWLPTGPEDVYNAGFFRIANTEVLAIGLFLLILAMVIRTRVEGPGWIRWYMPESFYRRFFLKKGNA